MNLLNIWLVVSLTFFLIWILIFIFFKKVRKEMLWVSLFTLPLGLTEPLFVPEYWNPPSLFNLALKTGFDIESFIFAFSIGGIAAVLYEIFFKVKHKKMNKPEIHLEKNLPPLLILLSPLIIFILLELFAKFNIIYSLIISIFSGGILAVLCRPDLKKKILIGGILFFCLYFLLFLFFDFLSPGEMEKIWNFSTISGILFLGVPIEELLFAFGVGMLWSSIYEYVKHYKLVETNHIKNGNKK